MTLRVWITSYDEPSLLSLCVKSWLRYTKFPITVVDNYSTEDTQKAALSLRSERVQVIPLLKNVGHAEAMRLAQDESVEDKILFCDQDIEVLSEITVDDLPDANFSGVLVPRFVDPITGCYTADRFHSSFLALKRSSFGPFSEVVLPLAQHTIRYDTASLLYNLRARTGETAELSDSLKAKFIHYFTDSSKQYFTSAPQNIQEYVAQARETAKRRLHGEDVGIQELKDTYSSLWRAYCLPWKLEKENK